MKVFTKYKCVDYCGFFKDDICVNVEEWKFKGGVTIIKLNCVDVQLKEVCFNE